MSTAARTALACALVLVTASASARAAGTEASVQSLLDQALAAPSLKTATEKLSKAEALLAKAGGAKLTALAQEFLEADIARTRGQVALRFLPTVPKAKKGALRQDARDHLGQAAMAYRDLCKLCQNKLENIEENYEGDDVTKDAKWQQIDIRLLTARYQLAWQEYRLGELCSDAAGMARDKHFEAALEAFEEFTVNKQFTHPVVLDCLLGQSMCLHKLEKHDDLIELLETDYTILTRLAKVRGAKSQRTSHTRMMYVLVKAYDRRSGGAPSIKLETVAKAYFRLLGTTHEHDALSLELAVLRARNLHGLLKANDPALKRMAPAYTRALNDMTGIVELHGDPWLTTLDKALGRPPTKTATRALRKAHKCFNAKKYREAVKLANEAIAAAAKRGKAGERMLARLRYVKAASWWNLGKWRQAYDSAVEFVRRHPKADRAPDMWRRGVHAGLKALEEKPPLPWINFNTFLQGAKKALPDEPEIQKAPWHHANFLIREKRFNDAQRALNVFPPNHPLYRHAQYGLALTAYKQAEAAGGPRGNKPGAVQAHLRRGLDAICGFAKAPAKHFPDDDTKLTEAAMHLALAIGRNLLDLPTPLPGPVNKMLDVFAESDIVPETVEGRCQALRLEARMLAGGLDKAWDLVADHLDRAAVERHVAQAIARLADRIEKDWTALEKAGKAEQAQQLGKRLIRIYEFLHREIGHPNNAASRRQKLNLRRRLGNAFRRLGDHEQALAHYKAVDRAWPRGKPKPADVMSGLATAYERQKAFKKAAERWRTLARAFKPNTNDWYEARYHWIDCCRKGGRRAHAKRLLDYFRLQHPDIGDKTWAKKFGDLAAMLEPDGPAAPTEKQ